MPRQLPTKAESKAALDAQAPSQPPKRSKQTASGSVEMPSRMSLKNAGIDGEQRKFLNKETLFPTDDALVSEPFMILGARLSPNTLQAGTFNVVFRIKTQEKDEDGQDEFLISMSQDDNRTPFVNWFTTNTVPLGPVEIHKLPSQKPGRKPYLAIHDAPDDVIPF